jgi:hypothetical protein
MAGITTLAQGITGALQLRDMGALPKELIDSVQMTVEGLRYYLWNRRENIACGQNAAPVVGTNLLTVNNVPVPPGEMWFLWNGWAAVDNGVGTTLDFALGYAEQGNLFLLSDYFAAIANQSVRARYNMPEGYLLPPGSALAVHARSVTGAPTVSVNVIATRLKI